jgi:hypothetical protein
MRGRAVRCVPRLLLATALLVQVGRGERGVKSAEPAMTEQNAIDWASHHLVGLPSLSGAASRSSSSKRALSAAFSFEDYPSLPAADCLYTEAFCQCKRAPTAQGSKMCLERVGRDPTTGRSVCAAAECPPEDVYVCDCAGDTLCHNAKADRVLYAADATTSGPVGGSRAAPTYFCSASRIAAVEPLDGPDSLDTSTAIDLRAETASRTVSWNATHCTCTPKVNLVRRTTCFDLFQSAAAAEFETGTDLCRVRACDISPSEMVCDLMTGTSLCERSLVYTEHYRAAGKSSAATTTRDTLQDGSLRPANLLPCQLESGAIERPRCVSSCV